MVIVELPTNSGIAEPEIKDIVDPARIKEVGPSGNDDVYFARETARDGSSSQAMRRFHGFWIKKQNSHRERRDVHEAGQRETETVRYRRGGGG
jgi:hypothetical protein